MLRCAPAVAIGLQEAAGQGRSGRLFKVGMRNESFFLEGDVGTCLAVVAMVAQLRIHVVELPGRFSR